jgi:crotonobetainyl-CoA:carnitine CoA-transferase CaiB-like acyl-CoA transferase
VRDLIEVMNDPHMHARGALEWFDDPDLGRIVLPASPIILHGADRVGPVASPKLGQHNAEIFGKWLGLSSADLDELRAEEVI